MALPYLIKHIYNNGSEEVIRRGKKIHANGGVELIEFDELMNSISFRVKDDSYSIYYKVYINHFKDPRSLTLKCTCPYNLSDVCKHKAAALIQMQEMMDRNQLGNKEMVYDQKHTVVKMKQLDLKTIKLLTSSDSFIHAEDFVRSKKAKIISAKEERVQAELDFNGKIYKLLVQKNEERNFDTSCNCASDTTHPLCVHKVIILL